MPTLRPRSEGEREAALDPQTFAHMAFRRRDLAQSGQQQAQRQVGDFLGQHARACSSPPDAAR
jgi:hypothetical protein